MSVVAVVGAQWGDEGKGKIVDLLAQKAHIVCRFGGGSNAGHTIVNDYGSFKLHSLPSGVFNPQTLNIVGSGAVVDFDSLSTELSEVRASGIETVQLIISDRSHVIMPYHRVLDRLREEDLGEHRVGTTGRGIGPAYVDKVDRVGFQAGELLDLDRLRGKLLRVLRLKTRGLEAPGSRSEFNIDAVLHAIGAWRDEFGDCIQDTIPITSAALAAGRRMVLEGQLGVMRDIDWGTYPYVTSSTTFAAGGGPGAGIPPRLIDTVIGVVKAYTTAVGEGPLPTELFGPEAGDLRERGQEYGATTGRPRRVGWLDGVALRYAATVGALTEMAITKLDVLDGLDSVQIAVAYEREGQLLRAFPHPSQLEGVKPVYESLPGWSGSAGARSWQELPVNARRFIRRIEELVGVPTKLVGNGPQRATTLRVPAREDALVAGTTVEREGACSNTAAVGP